MTDADLQPLILADPTAKALADAGNDSGCAARMTAILPPALQPTMVDSRGIFAAFSSNPPDAAQVMQALATASATNPAVAAVLTWMTPPAGGVDVSNAAVITTLGQLVAASLITQAQSNTIQALAQVPQTIGHTQVSRIWAQYRPNGYIGAPSS